MIRELAEKSRSWRGYDENVTVSRQTLTELVDCARLCPSSVNKQPLKYYLACKQPEVGLIQQQTMWAKALPDITLPHPGKYPTAFIVICQDTDIDPNLKRFLRDVGAVAQTMLLAATEKGLGGIMIGSFNAGAIHEALGLAENIHPMLVVAIGKPAEEIVLTGVPADGNTNYWRDANDVHYVPKRTLADELLN